MDQRTVLIAVAVLVVLGIIWYAVQAPPKTVPAPPPAPAATEPAPATTPPATPPSP